METLNQNARRAGLTTNLILHILRNPHGYTEEQCREARLQACEIIEKLGSLKAWEGGK